jgi:hypothetical protein
MAFLGGALADYLDRRLLVIVGEVAFTVLTGALLVNALLGRPQLWLLFVVAGLSTTVDGLQRPALDAVVPRLVPPEQIPAASVLNTLRMNVASLAGPALGGILLASVSLAWVFAIDLATFAFSLACLALVRRVPPPPAAERPSLRTVGAGLRYAVRPARAARHLPRRHQRDVLRHGPVAVPVRRRATGRAGGAGSALRAPSAGSLLATLASRWTAGCTGTAWRSPSPPARGAWRPSGLDCRTRCGWRWCACCWPGAADMISGIFRMIIWNQTIPDHLRGRMAGIEMLSYTIGPTLGNARAGAAAGPSAWPGRSSGVAWRVSPAWSRSPRRYRSSCGTTAATASPVRSPRTRRGPRPPKNGRPRGCRVSGRRTAS